MPPKIVAPPKAEAERVSNLVNRINNGEIKIPKFQRGFVWNASLVPPLLETTLQANPMGSLLLWRTEQKLRSEKDIQGFHLPSTLEKYPTNYVLDGQQRLTTIYGVLSWRGSSDQSHILNVVYDLRLKSFRHRKPEDGAHCLPLNILFEFSKFNAFEKRINELSDSESLIAEAERVNETFREYQLPVVTITDRTLEEVCPIFERINSTGMKLTVFDLMVAATYGESFDLNEEVSNIAKAFDAKGFGSIEGVSIIKTQSAIHFNSIKRSSLLKLRSLREGTADKSEGSKDAKTVNLAENLAAAKAALARAIDFLRAEVGVISMDFLPYDAQLTILSKLCHLSPTFTPSQRQLIRSWFWQSSFLEHYRGASDTTVDADLEQCSRLLANLEPLIRPRKIEVGDLLQKEFRKDSAITNAYVALLASNKPLNLTNGAPIDVEGALSWSNRKEFHHVFPKAYLSRIGDSDDQTINRLFNFVLLSSAGNKAISSKAPSQYFGDLSSQHGLELDKILASNLIPPLTDSGLLQDDYQFFLEMRADYIATYLNRMILIQ